MVSKNIMVSLSQSQHLISQSQSNDMVSWYPVNTYG